jgi:uncharacterized Zn-binding protein involved in type VI secretion
MPGVCRLGDKAKAQIDVHGCPACPHPNVIGPSISASSNVFVNGAPALRVDDIGMHTACCGTNMWQITSASGKVFVNGSQVVRQGDPTLHCGGIGKMVDASATVVDGSPLTMKPGSPFGAIVGPPLPPNQVMLYPDMEPHCVSADNRGGAVQAPDLPISGGPQVYDASAAAARRAANTPHAEPGPTKDEQAAGERRLAANYWLAGNDDAYKEHNAAAVRLEGESKVDRAKDALKAALQVGHDYAAGIKSAKDARDKLEEAQREARANLGIAEMPRDPNLEEEVP